MTPPLDLDRDARLGSSRAKVLPPFALDETMRFYCPQENVEAFAHPRVAAFHDFLLTRYTPPAELRSAGRRLLLLLPCSRTKPYPASREHRGVNSALLGAGFAPLPVAGIAAAPDALLGALAPGEDPRLLDVSPLVRGDTVVHRMVISEPLGLVPYELVYTWRGEPSPASAYDDPGLFEHRGTSVCPWRADSTATAGGDGGWRWGSSERRAYVTAHNRLADLIARVLARLAESATYTDRIAWVAPGLTHRSFLRAAAQRPGDRIAAWRHADGERLPLVGVNDLVPGLVDVRPTRAELRRAPASASPLVAPELLAVLVRLASGDA